MDVQTSALSQCANTDNGGAISACQPLAAVDSSQYSYNCPHRSPLINEPTRGMIAKLPGCINITPGPGHASSGDMSCPANTTQSTINTAPTSSGPTTTFIPDVGVIYDGWKYLGCANETRSGRSLTGASYSNTTSMTNKACQTFCATGGFPLAATEYGQEYVSSLYTTNYPTNKEN